MNEIERDDIRCAMDIAKEALETAHIRCSELANMLDGYGAGENGGAGMRMHAYIVPSLNSWLGDSRQIGSLASIEEELAQADSESIDSKSREPNENLHGFHTPRGDWPNARRNR